jgi:hypothetical protein
MEKLEETKEVKELGFKPFEQVLYFPLKVDSELLIAYYGLFCDQLKKQSEV